LPQSEDLDSMFSSLPAREPRAPSRLNYSHDGMIDLIVENPGISQNELAVKLGYSAPWVSTVMSTDTFKTALEKRRKELIDPVIAASIQERFEGLARRALEVIEEKLSAPASAISENFAIRSFEVASRAAGFGARDLTPPASPTEVHIHLDSMAENLTRLLHKSKDALEHAPKDPTP
jgi:hypothetical protein